MSVASPAPVAVAAVSGGVVVDVSHGVRAGSYYGLNLPAGEYRLLAVRDGDGDGVYRGNEIAGERALSVRAADGVLRDVDIPPVRDGGPAPRLAIPVRAAPRRAESLFYPRGTLRTLDDPLFRPEVATLGLYDPAAFLEAAPLMFYALDEDEGHKVPVVFVHGIGGSPRDFASIVQRLDRTRYRPWFFYYPSGGRLDQLGHLFYEIFLSGTTIPRQETPVAIVAHSMGGLVVRDALNRHRGGDREQNIGAVITIASPLGGHPAATYAARAPVVIPCWRSLDPSGTFVARLHRTPLRTRVPYHLFYTYRDDVVPLTSQLPPAARMEATTITGFAAGHEGVLHQSHTVAGIVRTIETVKSIYPEEHLRVLDAGGYELDPGPELTAVEAHLVRSAGRYLDALVRGELQPFHPDQQKFIDAALGKTRWSHPAVHAWQKMERWRAGNGRSGVDGGG